MKKIIAIDIGNSETNVGVGNSTKWESYRYTNYPHGFDFEASIKN